MNNQTILRSCRTVKLDRSHSKNVIKNDSGTGKRGQIHLHLLHQWYGSPLLNHLLRGHQENGNSTERNFFCSQGASVTRNGDSLVIDRRCKQHTAPRTHPHAQIFLARGSSSHCSVLCVRCLQNSVIVSRACHVSHFA